MRLQVQQFISRCLVHDQIRVLFNALTLHLQPSSIMGFGYYGILILPTR